MLLIKKTIRPRTKTLQIINCFYKSMYINTDLAYGCVESLRKTFRLNGYNFANSIAKKVMRKVLKLQRCVLDYLLEVKDMKSCEEMRSVIENASIIHHRSGRSLLVFEEIFV